MLKKVLITGAAGFIGRYVARSFAKEGFEVTGIGWGKFPEFKKWGLSKWNECEISMQSLYEFVKTPDYIIHCAGGSSVAYSLEHPRHDFLMTVQTTSDLLEYIRIYSPATRLVYLSSAAVYGSTDKFPIPESASLNPISPYGFHKLMGENLCKLYATYYNLKVVVVRLFSVYGEELRKQLLWDACNKFSKGVGVFFGSGEETRDFLHVSDAARLLMTAASHASNKCPIVNGGSGQGVKIKEVLDMVASLMEYKKAIQFMETKKKGDPEILVADNSLISKWGWAPKIDLRNGIKSYVTWFLQCL